MRHPLRTIALSALAVLATSGIALACGDKLVVLGGGVRFDQIDQTRHLATIILFTTPNSQLRTANEELKLAAALKRAGYAVQLISNRVDLDRMMTNAVGTDIVLVDWTDAAELGRHGAALLVLPVIFRPTPAELAVARQQSPCVAAASKRGDRDLLQTVDQLVRSRAKGLPVACAGTAQS